MTHRGPFTFCDSVIPQINRNPCARLLPVDQIVRSRQVCCKSTEGSAAMPRGHGVQISCWGSTGTERSSKVQSVILSQYPWHQRPLCNDYSYLIPWFNYVIRIYLLSGCLFSEGGATEDLAWPEPLRLSVICKARRPSANFGRV